MSPKAQIIAIAEACGWQFRMGKHRMNTPPLIRGAHANGFKRPGQTEWTEDWVGPHGSTFSINTWERVLSYVPDYVGSLDAIHEAERHLDGYLMAAYRDKLALVCNTPPGSFLHIHATAAQRAEAFLRTVGKWTDQ